MKNNKLTLIGLTLAITFYLYTVIFHVDLFEIVISILESKEKFELDELIIPVVIYCTFAMWDLLRERKLVKLESEKVKIYTAMLSSSHHILNNFLNQMQLFRITAAKTPGFPPEVISMYDSIMKDAQTQIKALGNITNIDEKSILESVAPK